MNNQDRSAQSLEAIKAEYWDYNSSAQGVYDVIDGKLHVVFLSDGYYEMIGGKREERRQYTASVLEAVHPEDRHVLADAVTEAIRTGGYLNCRGRILGSDGNYVWIGMRGTHRQVDEHTWRFYITYYDITELVESGIDVREEVDIRKALVECIRVLHQGHDVNQATDEMLAQIGGFYDAERAYIFEYDEAGEYTDNTYEWCAPGVTKEIDNLQHIPLGAVSRWEELFDTVGYVNISMLDEDVQAGSDEYEILAAQGIRSLMVIPVSLDGKRIGFIGVDDMKRYIHSRTLLESVAAFIADATRQRQLEARIMAGLQSDNDRLMEMMNSVSAGIVIGKFVGQAGQFTSVNKYFCDILGLTEDEVLGRKESGDLNDGRDTPGLLEAIHPDDLQLVFSYFMSLCEGEGKEDEAVFRLKTMTEPAGHYFACRSRTILKEDGSYTIYSVYTDATNLQRQKADFDRVMQELLITNPNSRCAYHLNLTRNLCSDCHGATEFTQHILDASSADELLHRVGSIVLDDDVREDFAKNCTRERLIERFHQGESQFSLVYRRQTDGRRYLWVKTFYHLLRNPSTGDIEAIAYTLNIDREHKEEQLFDQLAEKEFYAYGVLDVETHMCEHYYLDGQTVDENTPGVNVDADMHAKMMRCASAQEAEDFRRHTEVDYIVSKLSTQDSYSYSFTMDGRRMQLNYRYLDDRKDYISFSITDISEVVAREEESANVLREALAAAEAANAAKTDFLSRMSHDIRTPMNAIIGFSTLLLRDADDPDKVRDEARKILNSSNHLLGLINDVLDMSKIESGNVQLNISEFSLPETLATIDAIMRPQMEKKGQIFDLYVSGLRHETFVGDQQRLQQVLINVLSNATKYTPEGGRITLRVNGLRETSGKFDAVSFEITDNGRGMTEEYQKILFEPFSREQLKGQEQAQGTGLGMAITRNLVNMMSGTISVRSRLGEGSTFTIVLPMHLPDAQADRAFWKTHSMTHMLVVDDEEEVCLNVIDAMQDTGVRIEYALDGATSVTTIEAAHGQRDDYDIVLLDWKMPGMDGIETARAIRRSIAERGAGEAARDVLIIVLTAYDYSSIEDEARAAGVDGFILKPFFTANLQRTIEQLQEGKEEKEGEAGDAGSGGSDAHAGVTSEEKSGSSSAHAGVTSGAGSDGSGAHAGVTSGAGSDGSDAHAGVTSEERSGGSAAHAGVTSTVAYNGSGAAGSADAVSGASPAVTAATVLNGLQILAAEDNDLNAEILTELLGMNGATVTVYPDGQKALQAYIDAPVGAYGAILLDVQMPVMDGHQTARGIRALAGEGSIDEENGVTGSADLSEEKRREAARIPVVAMTANAFSDDVQRALEAGMDAHVAKPLNIEHLKETLARVMREKMWS